MSITLKELAEISGCSIRTVSRALSRSGPVAEEKRRLIETLARKYRYTPNMAARNLKTDRRSFVGVIAAPEVGLLSRKLIDLTMQLEQRGFYPLLTGTPATQEQFCDVLRSWAGLVDSVILYHLGKLPSAALAEARSRFDLRMIVMDSPDLGIDGVISLQIDRSCGIVEAVDELVAHGHRKILRWGGTVNRNEGWSQAAAKYPQLEFLHFTEPGEAEAAEAAGERILASGADALFCDTDRCAAGFLRFAARHGISIPEKLSVVGFDDEPFDLLLSTPLASVAQPIQEINAAAAEIIAGKAENVYSRIFPTRFVRRESVRSARRKFPAEN